MKHIKLLATSIVMTTLAFAGCSNGNQQKEENNMKQQLVLTQEWDKVFPLSEKVNHRKVTFETQYGLTLQPTSIRQRMPRASWRLSP